MSQASRSAGSPVFYAVRSHAARLGSFQTYSPGVAACEDCFGARALPDMFGDYGACPSCVIDAGNSFVVYEGDQEESPQA